MNVFCLMSWHGSWYTIDEQTTGPRPMAMWLYGFFVKISFPPNHNIHRARPGTGVKIGQKQKAVSERRSVPASWSAARGGSGPDAGLDHEPPEVQDLPAAHVDAAHAREQQGDRAPRAAEEPADAR